MTRESPLAGREMNKPCPACQGAGHQRDNVLSPCATCVGTGKAKIRCPQCWKWGHPRDFIGARGEIVRRCTICRVKYDQWSKKPLAERERATNPRANLSSEGPLRVKLVTESGNRKTGPIPVSMTSARTCPKSCPLFNRGCYAEQHMVGMHWRRVSTGDGLTWRDFVNAVSNLPPNQLWRHNEAGDLPGDDGKIDVEKLHQLVMANVGKRGFTYTHKPMNLTNRIAIKHAVQDGFAINLSSDSLEEADHLYDLGIAPVVTTLPSDAPARGNRTPKGRHIVVCPAETTTHVTCERCKLCAVSGRKSIVGFRAHGDRRKQITTRMRQLPLIQ